MSVSTHKQARFDSLKVGSKVMVKQGSGIVQSFGKNGIGADGVVVKFKDGSMKGLYTVNDLIVCKA